MEALLTVEALAQLLAVPKQRIYAWRSEGKGPPAIKLAGHLVRFRVADVERWLQQQAGETR